jgi:hypothetical protein
MVEVVEQAVLKILIEMVEEVYGAAAAAVQLMVVDK